MWKHHMTSPNFGENFECIYQKIAVQKGAPKIWKIILKALKFMEINYANKSTNIELFL